MTRPASPAPRADRRSTPPASAEATTLAAAATDARLRALLEGVDILAVAVDVEGRVTFANPRVCELTGQSRESIFGLDWFASFVPEEERAGLRALWADAIASDLATARYETGLLDRAGAIRQINWSSSILRDPDGRPTGCVALGDDVTASRQARALERRLSAALQQTAESVVITDLDGSIIYVNPAFERVSGYTAAEVLGRNPKLLQSGQQDERFYAALWTEITAGRTWQGELVNRAKDGHLYVESVTITPVREAGGDITNYVAVKRDVSMERALAAEIDAAREERIRVARMLAEFEPLETPEATAQAIVDSVSALPDIESAWIVIFDADGGASIFAATENSWPQAFVGVPVPTARVKGLFVEAADAAWARPWVRHPGDDAFYDASVAAGITATACAPIGNGQMLGVLRVAATGPDGTERLERHLPAITEFAAASRSLLVPALRARQAMLESRTEILGRITDRAFAPVFQPVVRLDSGSIVGFEALTRFGDGRRPDLVFGEATRVGLGLELEIACLDAAMAAADELPERAWLSLNTSPRVILEAPGLPHVLAGRSRQIVLEITEHERIDDYTALRSAIIHLGSDLLVAVDDAGAGVANFSHLVELRPDFVKIDISLVRGVNADLTRQALVVGLRHFARATNRDVIAEGIETDAERRTLHSLGIQYGQGYLFGRPAPAETWTERTGPAGRRPGARRSVESRITMPVVAPR